MSAPVADASSNISSSDVDISNDISSFDMCETCAAAGGGVQAVAAVAAVEHRPPTVDSSAQAVVHVEHRGMQVHAVETRDAATEVCVVV